MDKDPKQYTVAEYLFSQCSKSLLKELAADSEYWARADKFVDNNVDKLVGELSFAQRDWLVGIKTGLIEAAESNSGY